MSINKPFKFNIINKLCIVLLVLFISACSEPPPPKEKPLSQWTTEQLVAKGQTEFQNQNYNKAYRYLKEAANRDDKEALYALGYMYYYGYGVGRDVSMAQDLIRRSAAFGHKPAIKALRLFVATRSTFSVDSNKPTYLSENSGLEKTIPNFNKQDVALGQAPSKTQAQTEQLAKINKNSQNTDDNLFGNKISTNNKIDNKVNETTKKLSIKPSMKFTAKDNKLETTKTTEKQTNNIALDKAQNIVDTRINLNKNSDKATPDAKIAKAAKELNSAWFNKQDPNNYTIQITARKSQSELEKFIYINNLQDKVNTFSYMYKNEIWFGAGMGVYKKPSQAYQAMIDELPSEIKARKPWVRQFKNIQDVG